MPKERRMSQEPLFWSSCSVLLEQPQDSPRTAEEWQMLHRKRGRRAESQGEGNYVPGPERSGRISPVPWSRQGSGKIGQGISIKLGDASSEYTAGQSTAVSGRALPGTGQPQEKRLVLIKVSTVYVLSFVVFLIAIALSGPAGWRGQISRTSSPRDRKLRMAACSE